MSQNQKDLGRLVTVYNVSPHLIQRAVFIAILSFLFFLAMMIGFYLRQNIGYFLLATGFLIVYLVMMISLFTQRRSSVKIFENGLEFKKHLLEWGDLESIDSAREIVLTAKDGRRISLPSSLAETDALVRHIKFKVSSGA
jgi:hypothetical protein